MYVKIKPRRKTDKGGYLMMPMKRMYQSPKMKHGLKRFVPNVDVSAGTDHYRKDMRKKCLAGNYVLRVQ